MTDPTPDRPSAAQGPAAGDHTQPLDLRHTQRLDQLPQPAQTLPPTTPSFGTTTPTGSTESMGSSAPANGGGLEALGLTGRGSADPGTTAGGATGGDATGLGDTGAAPPAAGGRSGGPGWLAVIAIAGLLALAAAVAGGIGGAYLAQSGRLDLSGSSYEAPTPEPGATERPAGTVASIAATALPSVVTLQVSGSGGSDTGSGWVFDDQGHIVTNNHVVEAGASGGKITVVLANGKHLDATIAGRDEAYDIAVVTVKGAGLARLPIGDSDDAVVGDQVIAVGAPLGLDSTVTTGIVSALNRPVSAGDSSSGSSQSFINAIQTDAAINPGNSGGPLLNMQGQVIGVNSAIAALPSGSGSSTGSIGLGFAIPSNQVARTAEQLIRTGKAEHPVIGVYLDQSYDGEGVKIADSGPEGAAAVTKGGPADKAGLEAGDVILSFDGRPISSNDELVVAIRSRAVGDEVTLKVRRDGKEFDVRMTLQAADE